jgi:hypothetical protein
MLVAAVPNGAPASAFAFADYVFPSLHQVAEQLGRLLHGGAIPSS